MRLPPRQILRRSAPAAPYPFARHLQDGETLLWQGRPHPARFAARKVLRDLLISVPILLLALWLESLRTGTVLFGSTPFWIIMSIALAGVVAHVVQEARVQAHAAQYAVSSRRIFFRRIVTLPTQEKQAKVDEFTLETVRPRLRGHRSIAFGFPFWQADFAFQDIADVRAVFQLLAQAKASLPHAPDAPYYAKRRTPPMRRTTRNAARPRCAVLRETPHAPDAPYYAKRRTPAPTFAMEQHLRRGERVLWREQPDVPAYVRSGMRIALPSFMFLVALFGGLGLASAGTWTWTAFAAILAAGTLAAAGLLTWGLHAEAQSVRYVLTNQRALVLKSRAGKTAPSDEYGLAQAHKMRFLPQKDAIGTIIFVKHSRFLWRGQGGTVATYEVTFKSVPGAADVFAQAQAA